MIRKLAHTDEGPNTSAIHGYDENRMVVFRAVIEGGVDYSRAAAKLGLQGESVTLQTVEHRYLGEGRGLNRLELRVFSEGHLVAYVSRKQRVRNEELRASVFVCNGLNDMCVYQRVLR